jgi:hypothetical protein
VFAKKPREGKSVVVQNRQAQEKDYQRTREPRHRISPKTLAPAISRQQNQEQGRFPSLKQAKEQVANLCETHRSFLPRGGITSGDSVASEEYYLQAN